MTSRQAEEKTNTLTGSMAKGQADTAFWIKNSFRNENSFTRHLQAKGLFICLIVRLWTSMFF